MCAQALRCGSLRSTPPRHKAYVITNIVTIFLFYFSQVFRREAEAVGVNGSRIHFTRGYSEEEHLLIKGASDVFLDTPS
jgi:hypothetical protein